MLTKQSVSISSHFLSSPSIALLCSLSVVVDDEINREEAEGVLERQIFFFFLVTRALRGKLNVVIWEGKKRGGRT